MRRRGSRRVRAIFLIALAVLVVEIPLAQQPAVAASAGVGPKRSIKCPRKAVRVRPGASIQAAVNRHPRGTAFCLRAGVHRLTGPITPKTGDRFIGEFGAIIDGSGWKTDDPNQGLFRAHNQDIDHVVIRNLVIRNSPQRGIHAFRDHSDRWIIENNTIHGNRGGISHGNFFRIRRNIIRGNWQYGIGSFRSTGSLIAGNLLTHNAVRGAEFPGDSGTSKWALVTNTTVRRNTVRDNYGNGIWFDTGHVGIRIVGNIVRRNGLNGIFTEVGGSTLIRNNTVTGHHRGIYISESEDATVTANTLANNDRGIWLFQDGNRRGEGELANNGITDNRVRVPSTPILPGVAPHAAGLACWNLSASQCAVYSTGRGNAFQGNAYTVPSLSGKYWGWENTLMTWSEWRAAGQDTTGSLKAG